MCNQRGIIGLRLDAEINKDMVKQLSSLISEMEFTRSRVQTFEGDTRKVEKEIHRMLKLKATAEKRVRKIKRALPEAGVKDD